MDAMQRRFERARAARARTRSTRLAIGPVATGLSAVLLLSACTGSSSPAPAPRETTAVKATTVGNNSCASPGGTLRMARDQDPTSLDPIESSGNNNLQAQIQIYDQLVQQLPGFKDPQPGLAEKWTVSSDGLTYDFTLRQAKFSDGTPITAEDVRFALQRAFDPEKDKSWAFLFTNVSKVEAVGSDRVRITTKVVDASLLASLTLPPAGIFPKKAFQEGGDKDFFLKPVGSGPFVVDRWDKGTSLAVVKNKYYWRAKKPFLDGVKFTYVKDGNARVLQISSGETDVSQSIPFDQYDSLRNKKGFTIQVAPYYVIYPVWLNHSVKPLDEKVVRQALNYATPKKEINDAILSGLGTPQNSMISPTTYWDPKVPAYPFDLKKAKALLAKSSVPDGFSIPLLITGGNSVQEQTATILQAEWAKIGVKVQIKAQDESATNDAFFGGKYTARLFSPPDISSDTPDDSEQASIMLDGTNPDWHSFFSNYNSPEATKLVKEGISTLDPAKRAAAYRALQKLGMEDAPQVAMLFTPTVTGVSDKVKGLQTIASGWWRLEDVCLAK